MKISDYFFTSNIRSVFLCTICLLFLFQSNGIWSQKPHEGKVIILAVFAHPDDESTVAPIFGQVRSGGGESTSGYRYRWQARYK